MSLKYNCIICGQEFKLEKEEGGLVIVVWKDGAKFYACSMSCGAEARDDDSKGPKVKNRPFAGKGRPEFLEKGKKHLPEGFEKGKDIPDLTRGS